MRNEIFLCKPRGTIIASLSVDEDSVSLTESVASPWELSFTIHRYVDLKETPYYHSLSEMMELYLVSDFVSARFIIDEEPAITSNGEDEIKTVTAHSIEIELQYKNLENFQINTGKPESQENLVKGDLGGNPILSTDTNKVTYDYNMNPYTNLPVDYITVACNLEAELNAFREDLTSTSLKWTFDGDDEPTTINFTFDSETGQLVGDTVQDAALLIKWYDEFVKKFPRVISDIIWGYDMRKDYTTEPATPSQTYGSVICVTDAYIVEFGGIVYIPKPTYIFEERVGEDAINIKYPDPKYPVSYTWKRFTGGLSKLDEYYKKFAPQLSLLDIVLEKAKGTGWTVGNVPEQVRVRKSIFFEVDNQDIYSFLTNTASHALKLIFDFDRVKKKVNVIDPSLDDIMFETGIVTGFNNLLQSVDITTGSTDGIKTMFKPLGADNLGVELVNFGNDKMINIDYFINKVDKNDDYQYGTAVLHDKYIKYKKYKDEVEEGFSITYPWYELDINTKTIQPTEVTLENISRREMYVELSKAYNQTIKDITDMTYLEPSDGAMTDYTSYSLDDLKVVFQAYLNAFDALMECWKTKFPPDTPIENTYLYADYVLYKDTIIPNVENALRMYALTDNQGNFLKSDHRTKTTIFAEFYYPAGGNPVYNANASLVTEPKATLSSKFGKSQDYLYEMSLYGLTELNGNKDSWAGAAAQIYKAEFVRSGTPGVDGWQYNTWNQLTDDQKAKFHGDSTAYERQLNNYLDYMWTQPRQNGLTKKSTKGVVVLATDEIKKCENVLQQLQDVQDEINELRQALSNSVTYEGWNEDGGFTDEEKAILYSLLHEADYNNNNILVTNINDIVQTVSIQEELYQDASKRLFDKSRPQYSFKITLDNILAIDGFEPLKDQLKLLNYFYLRYGLYDDETMKLRIVQMSFNPLDRSGDFSLEFSNMTYTYEGINDLYYLFEDNMGGSSGSTSSSSGGSSGTYGTNDAQITLSNNMLNALLRNDTTAHSLNIDNLLDIKKVENLLVEGDLQINGAAITDVIKSKNYDGTQDSSTQQWNIDNTKGSILRLNDGVFNFGGGKLTFNGSNLNMNNGTIIAGVIKSNDNGTVINLNNDQFSFANGKLKYNGTNLELNGKITATSGTIGGWNIDLPQLQSTYKSSSRSYQMVLDASNGTIVTNNDVNQQDTVITLNGKETYGPSPDYGYIYQTIIGANRIKLQFANSPRQTKTEIEAGRIVAYDSMGNMMEINGHSIACFDNALQQELARLNEAQQMLFELRFTQELTVPEIAAIIDIPEGTVKSRLNTLTNYLRLKLKDYE